jgi:uncharacterized protein YcgL (UPF0745 family)
MLCSIYKTNKKEGMFLFISRRDDFSQVPETLMGMFGQPKLVVTMNLTEKRTLAFADSTLVLEDLTTKGFYLQMPPPPIDHLIEYKARRDRNK